MPTQATGRQIDIFIINKSEKLALAAQEKLDSGQLDPCYSFLPTVAAGPAAAAVCGAMWQVNAKQIGK